MTVQIPLKRKYLSAKKGTYKGGERPADRKKRKKIGGIAHIARFGEAPRRVLVVNGKTGAGVMRNYKDVA